ncbi:SPX domain-containing protein [Vararia minispora EC-137]|uniref:SPX domain-containing protein n=1 Tax=Vararia minispora EC-137 TaxID=1314806 RepID=A0ACB8QCX8_9AGAM|nr:SPX domain-containing protein [Vararia minispora EC-137]
MKFSSSLKFNAVVDWWDEYIAYDTLKKYIYQLEKQQHEAKTQHHDLEANEATSLVSDITPDTDAVFRPLLGDELHKISTFYAHQIKKLIEELEQAEELVREQDELGLVASRLYAVDEDDDEDDEDDEGYTRDPSTERPMSKRRRRTSLSIGPLLGSVRSKESPVEARRTSLSAEDNEDLERSLASLRQTQTLPPEEQAAPAGPSSRSRNRDASPASPTIMHKFVSPFASTRPQQSAGGETIWTATTNYALDTQYLFKRRFTNLFTDASSLKSYVEMNYSGFRKILKKYDKVTESSMQRHYMRDVVEQTAPFDRTSRQVLAEAQDKILQLYAKCVTHGDGVLAQRQLKAHLREHIAWERDTVWRQMIGRERRGDGGVPGPVVEEKELRLWTPLGHVWVGWKLIWVLVALAAFAVLLAVPVVESPPASRCFAILVFATILWATEALPLFVTALAVPPLLVWLRVIVGDNDEPMAPPQATKWIFAQMFSPTLMLLIGGFTIAAALSKTNIDRMLITRVLSLAGTRPSTVLLTVMGVACFASMWISNVAAPTLCFALVRPILRTLPPKSSFGPCLILGIALAANIGGQSSPISSPQNLIALDYMNPRLDWGRWFLVAIPVSAVSILLIWVLLLVAYQPATTPKGDALEIKTIRASREGFNRKQVFVAAVCVFTIALWCFARAIEGVAGDMGVLAAIPIIAFFGTGILTKDDFEQFLWTVVFLAMGGIALGKGVTSSGLLQAADGIVHKLVAGLSIYPVVLVLSMTVLVVSTFISHTIASVLLVPIAMEVGQALEGDRANLLIFITGLICSTGMGMPVSGFPNQQAATQTDEMGQLYLTNIDFLKVGVPASIIAALVVATLGFLLMNLLHLDAAAFRRTDLPTVLCYLS